MSAITRRCVACSAPNVGLRSYPAPIRDGVCAELPGQPTVPARLRRHRAHREPSREQAIRAAIGGSDAILSLPSNHARTARLPVTRRAAFAAFIDGLLAEPALRPR